ncbi:major facilitator superfamily domain-containing protein [Massariosphaeria phaeospora]|uniref:Major facilitator superfamily domain-containing protein n=1 Tax=Massariosphaeria phaeospora TaxID=100035 RepID=A0A7C8MDU8_9PLEO|nr:major facilitator superfamily domain-containing protein [Massariosphaeria phaeospora]
MSSCLTAARTESKASSELHRVLGGHVVPGMRSSSLQDVSCVWCVVCGAVLCCAGESWAASLICPSQPPAASHRAVRCPRARPEVSCASAGGPIRRTLSLQNVVARQVCGVMLSALMDMPGQGPQGPPQKSGASHMMRRHWAAPSEKRSHNRSNTATTGEHSWQTSHPRLRWRQSQRHALELAIGCDKRACLTSLGKADVMANTLGRNPIRFAIHRLHLCTLGAPLPCPMPSTTTTEEQIELASVRTTSPISHHERRANGDSEHNPAHGPDHSAFSTTAIPDGGYGWTIVFCCSVMAFWQNGIINCWGVLQAALLDSTLKSVPTSTVSFIGSLHLAGGVFYSLLVVRLMRWVGSRTTSLIGMLLMGMSLIGSSFCTSDVAGLFGTAGLLAGVGMAMIYTVSNTLPVQYFSGHLGLANGLVKLGGGVGATVMALALEALYRRVGIAWTFRIQGLLTIGTGLPAAYMLKDRVPLRDVPFADLSMFRSLPFVAVVLAAAIGTFALFVPPYFLPLFAQSIGLSPSTGAALVAAFNACNAVGRFVAGPLCDKIGPMNMFLITMVLNAVSMLAIWPVSSTLGPLVAFAVLNGVANGSFFTTMPTVAAGMFGPGRAAVAMSMAVTAWTGGYLMGAPIAGYLLQAAGGRQEGGGRQDIAVYRPAIFYAGGVATASAMFVLAARVKMGNKISKRA